MSPHMFQAQISQMFQQDLWEDSNLGRSEAKRPSSRGTPRFINLSIYIVLV